MQAPPPYVPPQRKSKTGLIIGIVLGAICLCCIGPILLVGGLGFWGFSKVKGTASCSLTFASAKRAVMDYARDHDGKLPKAATWQDDVRPYYQKAIANLPKSAPFSVSDPNGDWGCVEDKSHTGVAFNDALSGKKMSEIKNPDDTVLLFEIPAASHNAHQPYKKQDISQSPLLMGSHRGWFEATVEGDVHLLDRNGRRVKFNGGAGSGFDVSAND